MTDIPVTPALPTVGHPLAGGGWHVTYISVIVLY